MEQSLRSRMAWVLNLGVGLNVNAARKSSAHTRDNIPIFFSYVHTHLLSPFLSTHTLLGIACNLDSDAFKKLTEATKEVIGAVSASHTPSLAASHCMVGDLQQAGFDVQVGHGIQSFSSVIY